MIAKTNNRTHKQDNFNKVFKEQKNIIFKSTNSTINDIFSLQRSIGNQAVKRLFESGTIQGGLKIGHARDKHEQDANRVVSSVMRKPDLNIQPQPKLEEEEKALHSTPIAEQINPLVQRPVEEKEKEEPVQAKVANETKIRIQEEEPEEEKGEAIQTKQINGKPIQSGCKLEDQINSMKNGGQPLPESMRKLLEKQFGENFSAIRVHTGEKATQTARILNAKAFTLGQNIVFESGQYSPQSHEGRRLMAHELTHVLQQRTNNKRSVIQRQVPEIISGRSRRSKSRAYRSAIAAQWLRGQRKPYLWFDSWYNDRRDNTGRKDKQGHYMVDTNDPKESKTKDGTHYSGRYRTPVCRISGRQVDQCYITRQNKRYYLLNWVSVIYRVCIDIPAAAYRKARIPFPKEAYRPIRSVNSTVNALRRGRHRRYWRILLNSPRKTGFKGPLRYGDFVARTGHSGIVDSSGQIIHLPGPSHGHSGPTDMNDIETGNFGNYTFVARPRI